QLGTSLVITAAILLQWPEHRRRLLDWWLALVLTFLFCQALKMTFGRVRPGNFNEGQFTLPWQSTLVEKLAREPVRAWDLLHRDASDLWSMPSSHAAAAVVLSVFLATVFPRLTPLVIVLAGLVGAARVIFEDHFPSDVVVGLALGYLIASS